MPTTPNCPDCNKTMEKGFIPDFSYGTTTAVEQTIWHPGDAEERQFLGVKMVKMEKSKARKIVSYRCPGCGLLRSYGE